MADFHQNGNIAQFHNLRARPLEELVYEIETFSQTRKISLILPSLYSELEGEALPAILAELAKVPYLHRIIIGLDRADGTQVVDAEARVDLVSLPRGALHGGEDYELLFASSSADEQKIVSLTTKVSGSPPTKIGTMIKEDGIWLEGKRGRERLRPGGYWHFS